ncbi:MAG: lactonase family protein [Lentimonas sp.]
MHHLLKHCICLLSCFISLVGHAKVVDVYFGTAGSGGIQHANFDTTDGTITAPTKVAEVNNAGFIAIHPNRQFLYSTATSELRKGEKGQVAAFKINSDQSLTLLNKQSSEGASPCHVSTSANGSTVMVANYNSNASVAAYKVTRSGSLARSDSIRTHEGSGEHPKRQTSPHPHSISPNPSNNFAYSPDLGTDRVEIYALDASKAILTPAGKAEVTGGTKGPRHMKFSKDGKFAYVLNELSMEIATYTANAQTGALEYIESVSTMEDRSDIEKMNCAEIRVHPNGKFIYNSNRDLLGNGRDAISVYSIDEATGLLTLIQNEPARVWVPRNFNIEPSGQWLITGGQKSKNLAIFKLDSTTGLLEPHGENIAFDGSPTCIEFLQD